MLPFGKRIKAKNLYLYIAGDILVMPAGLGTMKSEFPQSLLLPVMLTLFVLRVLVKIGIELSSIILSGLILIIFGCIIYAIVQQMWPSMCILIAMEVVLNMVTAGAGILDLLLEETMLSFGGLIRA